MYLRQPLQYFLLKSISIGKIWHTCKFNGHFIEVRIPMAIFFRNFWLHVSTKVHFHLWLLMFWQIFRYIQWTVNFFSTFDVLKLNAKTLFQLNNDEWSIDKSNETREIFWITRKIKHQKQLTCFVAENLKHSRTFVEIIFFVGMDAHMGGWACEEGGISWESHPPPGEY
jgi:hypothetical protein